MGIEEKYQLDYAIHPGEYLEELLEACNMSQKELADRTQISTKHINQIIKGKANVTAKTAIDLEHALDRSAKYWLDLQLNFDEFCERRELVENLKNNLEWIRSFDYAEITNRGFVNPTRDIIQKGLNLLLFFQVASVDAWYRTWVLKANEIYCRSGAQTGTDVKDSTIARLASWIRMGQIEALKKVDKYPAFQPEVLKANLSRIRDISVVGDADAFTYALTESLKIAGVLIQFVKEVCGMRTYGTSFMVRNNEVACIQLCLRGRTNDQLWFSIMHEIYHLVNRGNNKGFLIGHSKNNGEEAGADEFASEVLIPKEKYSQFVANKVFTAQSIITFAKNANIHESIVIGRLQHDHLIGFNILNQLKVKYKWSD